jgi:hypothetical protein
MFDVVRNVYLKVVVVVKKDLGVVTTNAYTYGLRTEE